MAEHICRRCGKSFWVKASQVAKGAGLTCSLACRYGWAPAPPPSVRHGVHVPAQVQRANANGNEPGRCPLCDKGFERGESIVRELGWQQSADYGRWIYVFHAGCWASGQREAIA